MYSVIGLYLPYNCFQSHPLLFKALNQQSKVYKYITGLITLNGSIKILDVQKKQLFVIFQNQCFVEHFSPSVFLSQRENYEHEFKIESWLQIVFLPPRLHCIFITISQNMLPIIDLVVSISHLICHQIKSAFLEDCYKIHIQSNVPSCCSVWQA